MNIKYVAKKILPPIISDMIRMIRNAIAYRHYQSKRIPFSRGHYLTHFKLITASLKNSKLLYGFRQGELLPTGYGIGFSE